MVLIPASLQAVERGVELDDAVHRAVVGDAQGGHPLQIFRAIHHRRYAAQAVEQAIFRMNVKVREGQR